MTESRELADPGFFSRLDGIELRARAVVEGFLHGLHRSPLTRPSVQAQVAVEHDRTAERKRPLARVHGQ